MLQPIYLNQQNFYNNHNKNVKFNGASSKIKKELSQKVTADDGTIEDMRFKYNIIILTLAIPLVGLSILYMTGNKSSSGFSLKKMNKFASLKNDAKVPNLSECKSINKGLKAILERQVNLNKAENALQSEFSGETLQSNRFLLYGPPGVGKSFFAKIYAKAMDAKYMEVLFSDLNSRWVGDTEGKMNKIFNSIQKEAQKNPKQRYVVTFNEIDSLMASAENLSDSKGTHWVSVLRQRSIFLNKLELLKEKAPNVTIIGTTNISPQNSKMDKASMSRFQNLIEVPYPDKDSLFEALKMNLQKLNNKDKFFADNDEKLKTLANQMANRKFSFRNLENIVKEAKCMYVDDKLKALNTEFKMNYLEKSYNLIKLSDGELEGKLGTINT